MGTLFPCLLSILPSGFFSEGLPSTHFYPPLHRTASRQAEKLWEGQFGEITLNLLSSKR